MHRPLDWICAGALIVLWLGCAPRVAILPPPTPDAPASGAKAPQSPEADAPSDIKPKAEAPLAKIPEPYPNPNAQASMALAEQGRNFIEKKRPDAAIRVLERAVNVHPQNGVPYYYLAEAWLQKGHVDQAKTFHRLAGIYLHTNHQWTARLKIQQLKIQRY